MARDTENNRGVGQKPAPVDHRDFLPDGVAGTGVTSSNDIPVSGIANRIPPRKTVATDFQSLQTGQPEGVKRFQKRTATDWLIDLMTPTMIFVMVFSVIYFLINVRYVYLQMYKLDSYSQLYDMTLRWVAFFFVVGIVALNRLIARDGRNESVIYIFGLAVAIGLYTLTTTQAIGSLARNFMNDPVLATGFNMLLVAFIWWLTNRLTHECCVDENPYAGDIGILTGTARRLRNAVSGGAAPIGKSDLQSHQPLVPKSNLGTRSGGLGTRVKIRKKDDAVLYSMYGDLQPIDPLELNKPENKPTAPPQPPAWKRLPKRHPGVSIFYTSIPAMLIFAVGQRVLLTAGPDMVRKGHYYILAYTLAALMLLMLSSLGGIREYFRARRITIPAGIGPFWIGLGSLMVLAVLLVASRLPSPGLPFAVHYVQSSQVARNDRQGNGKEGGGDQSRNPNEERSSPAKDKRGNTDTKQSGTNASQAERESEKGQKPAASKDDSSQRNASSGKNQEESSRTRSRPQQQRQLDIPPMPSFASSRVVDILGKIAMGALILFGIYAGLRLVGMLAVAVAHRRGRGTFWGRVFGALDRLMQRLTRFPTLPTLRPRPRIQRAIALSTKFSNPLKDRRMTPKEMVEYSYTALCALAEDLAVPRRKDQTPYEFIQSFPEPLKTLRDDAIDLTNVYVVSAYSNLPLDESILNSVRKFWRSYEQVRRSVTR